MPVVRSALLRPIVLAGALTALNAPAAEVPAPAEADLAAARAIVQPFASELKDALGSAIQAGGPVHGIEVCRQQAPGIATRAAQQAGFTRVGRTSLKVRNPDNAPDAWELAGLSDFEARKAAGADPATLERAEIVPLPGGGHEFRYLKAIPTAAVCLNCHGSTLKPEVRAKIDALYPSDAARGFAEGDLRGAFTLRKPL